MVTPDQTFSRNREMIVCDVPQEKDFSHNVAILARSGWRRVHDEVSGPFPFSDQEVAGRA